jgi:ABC-2 type transport system ATP-binding protein
MVGDAEVRKDGQVLRARPVVPAAVPPTACGVAGEKLAIATSGLTKRFGHRIAVDGLDLAVPAGAICGFVGPNGAGKTTTIRMLLGLVRPTAGSGTVLGVALGDHRRYLPRVGALIEGPTFYPSLSGRENLAVLARLGGLAASRIDAVLSRVGLSDRAGDALRTYSLGMRQRLGIAAALLPDPALLILDEPTNGLDPHGIAEIRCLLTSFVDEGRTVFVSSHLLSEIEQVCQFLVVIEDGRLVFQGSVHALLASRRAQLLACPEDPLDAEKLLAVVVRAGHEARIVHHRTGPVVEVDAERCWAAGLNRLAMEAGITLVHLAERPVSLEEAFFAITGRIAGEDVLAGGEDGAR